MIKTAVLGGNRGRRGKGVSRKNYATQSKKARTDDKKPS